MSSILDQVLAQTGTSSNLDNLTIKVKVKDKLIDTGKIKLGAIIADNVKTGIGTLIYPGRKVLENTLPGEKII